MLRKLATAIAIVMLAPLMMTVWIPQAQAADGCTYVNPRTVHMKFNEIHGTTLELRANDSQVCAWGRIVNAHAGDLVWVDRSYNGGATWEQLGMTKVGGTGERSAFTPAYNDVNKLMRACWAPHFGAGWYPQVYCTRWW